MRTDLAKANEAVQSLDTDPVGKYQDQAKRDPEAGSLSSVGDKGQELPCSHRVGANYNDWLPSNQLI